MTPYIITYRMRDGSTRTLEILAVDAYRAQHSAPSMPGGRLVSILPKGW